MTALLGLVMPALLAMALACLVVAFALGAGTRNGDDDHQGPSDSDDGGTKPLTPDRPPPGPPAGEQPEWWPQFEREFAAYATRFDVRHR
jgi:hypothetical protein